MRTHCLALAGTLLVGAAALAQQSPATGAAPPATPPASQPATSPATAQPPTMPAAGAASRLDYLLQRWEKEMTAVRSLVARCTRTEVNNVNMSTDVFDGTARYLRPNLAVLDMTKRGKPEVYEKYICTGKFLYEYRPQQKVVRVHELPNGQGVAEDGFLSFLFGMKAEEAKRRYDLTLVKEDQWWIYLEILPKLPADKRDFQKARLVLSAATFLPRELWFQQPNGNEVKWDLPKVESGVPLNPQEFAPPATPAGWTEQRMPRAEATPPAGNVPPRVIRQQQ
jgi:TIGR03009 family protein